MGLEDVPTGEPLARDGRVGLPRGVLILDCAVGGYPAGAADAGANGLGEDPDAVQLARMVTYGQAPGVGALEWVRRDVDVLCGGAG